MPHSPLEYLRHILDEIEYLITENEGLTKANFQKDPTRKRAYVRSIEIIGEASKKISPDLKSRYAEINWRALAALQGFGAVQFRAAVCHLPPQAARFRVTGFTFLVIDVARNQQAVFYGLVGAN